MNLVGGRSPQATRTIPFAVAAALAWVSVLVGSSIDWTEYVIACGLLLVAGAIQVGTEWRGRAGGVASSLIFLAAVGVLRGSAGGLKSGVAVVALVTVFFIALYGERAYELYAVIAGLAVFYLAPILLVGPPDYPHSQYRAALLTIAVAAIIGLATRRLVGEVRQQAGAARDRQRMLEEVHDVVRGLSGSTQARKEVCEAARSIGEASVAALFEPSPNGDGLRSTALAGLGSGDVEIPAGEHSAIQEAFATGQSRLITEGIESHLGSRRLWQAAGRPTSVLYEPLLRGSEPVGVLAVGWPPGLQADGPRVAVVALLAHEAAAVIDRADTLSELTDMASTDPLTGLPNRRAWDARVAKALDGGEQFTVALLDFDHFKEFNDTYGHPAGDRLLKETAAVWRDQLRTGDLLARLGGEEFGLFILKSDADRTTEVIERLRSLVYRNRTCSAGFAARRPGESADAVMARADAALYEAKASGRNRTCMSA